MNIRKYRNMAGLALLGFMPSMAGADGVLGLGLNYTSLPSADYNPGIRVNGDTGYNFFAAYRDERLPLMIELGYLDAGELPVKTNGTDLGALLFRGVHLSGGYVWRADSLPLAAWFRVGYYDGETSGVVNGQQNRPGFEIRTTRDSSGLGVGAGAEWMFSSRLGLRLSYDNLLDVADFSGADQKGESRLEVISLGFLARLGGTPQQTAMVKSETLSAPEPLPPAPAPPAMEPVLPTFAPVEAAVPEPVPEIPPPPSPPLPPPPEVTLPAVGAGTELRSQPKSNGRVILTFRQRQSINLLSSMTTPAGVWWYVSVPDGRMTGWLPDSVIER